MLSRIIFTLVIFIVLGENAQAAPFGRTAGQFTVSPTGAAVYTIPIVVPPGTHGLQPKMALTYNSQSGNGPLGMGWSLGGLSSISRCNATYAQDSGPAAVTFRYCLDGNRLRLTSSENLSTYGNAGTTYQTEIADFSNITASTTMKGIAPSYFTVQRRDGLTYEYGNGGNSQIVANSSATTWYLDKVTDKAGNTMTIAYLAPNGNLTGTEVPATISWTPTAHGSSTYVNTMQFTYGSTTIPAKVGYLTASNPSPYLNAEVLTNIETAVSGAVVKNYVLSYTPSTTTGRNTLTSITECADAAATNCLLPSTINYTTPGSGIPTVDALSGSNGTNNTANAVDFDGDGLMDIVFARTSGSTNHWYVQFALAHSGGFGAPVDTGLITNKTDPILFDDFLAEGKNDILAIQSGVWSVIRWNGSSFVSTSVPGLTLANRQTASPYGPYSIVSADVDGDGRPDLVWEGLDDKIYVTLNTSAGGTVSFLATSSVVGSGLSYEGYLFGNNSFSNTSARHLDFDGDGRGDVMYWGSGSLYTLMSRGTTSMYTNAVLPEASVNGFVPINWNDDGCTDIADLTDVHITGCGGNATDIVLNGYAAIGTTLIALDWYGDGRSGLLSTNSGLLTLYRSTGNGVAAPVATEQSVLTASTFVVLDANGDGLDDLAFLVPRSSFEVSYGYHYFSGPPDLLSSIADGYNVTNVPTYSPLALSGYSRGNSQVYPEQDYTSALPVVSSYSTTDGIGGTFNESYSYSGAVNNVQGRGFEGFAQVKRLDSRTNFWKLTNYATVFPNTGMLMDDSLSQNNTAKYIRNINYIPDALEIDSTPNNSRYSQYYGTITDKRYELGGSLDAQLISTTVSTQSGPDNYGNFQTVASTITDNDPNPPYSGQVWTTSTAYTISPDAGPNWCLNLPTEVDVTNTAPGSGAPYNITRHTTYIAPDYANCQQTEQVVESGGSYQVDTKYQHDAFGNLQSQTVTGLNMGSRTTTINWNTTNGQFPISVKDPVNPASQVSFDPTSGQLASIIDANGISSSWNYDSFSRKSKEVYADGTWTTFAYNNCATAGCANANNLMTVVATKVNTDGSTLSISNSYLDAFDRVLVTSKPMLNNAFDRNEVTYDNRGNIQQAAPCTYISCTYYWTANQYDMLNRPTKLQRPISATNSTLQTTSIAYAGRTTTTTDASPQAIMTSVDTLVTGALGRTVDANGYIVSFDHDAFGALLSVKDSLSNTLKTFTYGYGLQAFPQSSTDMDLGARSYTYDALGELTKYSDAKNQSFLETFDGLSRPLVRTEPDLTTTWTWGTSASNYNIGKLAVKSSVATAGTYSETYTYNAHGQTTDIKYVVPGYTTVAFDYGYSSITGLLQTLIYPQEQSPANYRVTAGYKYSQYGLLQQIVDSSNSTTIWWQAYTANPRGQITKETTEDLYGHPQIVSVRAFDAVTGWVNTIQTGVGSGSALQNEGYLYDRLGNVTQRQMNNSPGLSESFYYDSAYRLDHSVLGSTQNLQMAYDVLGNITSRSDVAAGATWTYDPVHKHQVIQTGTGGYAYQYDPNGNATSRNGSTIGWTSYNYPSAVATSTESATFDYGPDHQRWRMVYNGLAGTETTYYVSPMFEAVFTSAGTDFRHYIYANGRPVSVINRTTSGSVDVESLLMDHQGSISAIVADSTGIVTAAESFTAFGSRREASSWSGAPSSGELTAMNGVTRQGYTFQTVLGSMGLNHMKGRIQDSITGRFLSADPYVSDPQNTQTYNPYSYVNNNPLTYIDPTGFECSEVDPDGTINYFVCGGSDSEPPSGAEPPDPQNTQGPSPKAGGGSKQAPKAQSPQKNCVNTSLRIVQGATGAAQVIAGGVQAIEGVAQVGFGVFGAPETVGASLLVVGGGVANTVYGSTGVIDGGLQVLAAITGSGPAPSTFGLVGQRFGGEGGQLAGEATNLAGLAALTASDVTNAKIGNLITTAAGLVIPALISYVCGP